ncbi:helix-turn-helix domain-containing protein [Nocardia shimofusensis]|uniref:helix-turn-helix domain-containing protein n=1 Tax=Nocardia shimofusensis TaxID=228596 RepID=UPI000A065D9C|nr:helix-turn-helix domain-containing protein [Nocardia shimofusensis]
MTRPQPRRRTHAETGPLSEFGTYVVERRLTLGLTQQDVADLADVGLSSVRTLEGGKSSPTLTVTLRILDALGLTLVALPTGKAVELPGQTAQLRPESGVKNGRLA